MDFSQIMCVGRPSPRCRNCQFLSNTNIREFGIIIIDTDGLDAEAQQSCRGLSAGVVMQTLQQRFAVLADWLSEGHSLIAIVPSFPYLTPFGDAYQITYERVFTGIKFSRNSGPSIDYCGPAPARPLLARWAEHLEYNTTIE